MFSAVDAHVPWLTQTSKISRVAISRGTRLPYGVLLLEEVPALVLGDLHVGAGSSPCLRGTQTRPPSPRADSLIRRHLSAPGIAVGWTWIISPLPYHAPAW
jgi:hypothetical protein